MDVIDWVEAIPFAETRTYVMRVAEGVVIYRAKLKGAVGPDYAALDARLASAVHLRFGLPAALPRPVKAAIKRADRASAWLEATQLAGFTETEADRFFGDARRAGLAGRTLAPHPPAKVKRAFLARFEELLARC